MGILYTLLIGLVVGFIARAVMPGEQKLGWIMTAILGVAGSFLATFAGQALGFCCLFTAWCKRSKVKANLSVIQHKHKASARSCEALFCLRRSFYIK